MRGTFTVHQLARSHGLNNWIVNGRIDGKRIRAFYATKTEADEAARLRNIELQNHGHKQADMPNWLRAEAIRCAGRLEQIGASLSDATDFYIATHDHRSKSIAVAEATQKYMLYCEHRVETEQITNDFLISVRSSVNRLGEAFGAEQMYDLSPDRLRTWLNQLPVGTATKNSIKLRLSGFFTYASDCGWVRTNPIKEVKTLRDRKSKTKLPPILEIDQATRLLEAAPPDLLPSIAIGLFAGLRPREIHRLRWENILWEKRLIDVPAKIAKTAQARWVSMPDNLLAWLAPYRTAKGRLAKVAVATQCTKISTLAKAVFGESFQWPNDGLRHSFGSYHLAMHENAPLTAKEMGHMSTKMVYAHYNNRRTKEQGIAFFAIAPATAQNVVAMQEAVA